MFDIFINNRLFSIERDKDIALSKAVQLTDECPLAEIEVRTWDDNDIFHSYPTPIESM